MARRVSSNHSVSTGLQAIGGRLCSQFTSKEKGIQLKVKVFPIHTLAFQSILFLIPSKAVILIVHLFSLWALSVCKYHSSYKYAHLFLITTAYVAQDLS